MTPLVSILIPNFNHARFLPERIESILNQTFQDVELLGLDDCSTDNSREVLLSYSERAKMRLIFNERNSGSPFRQWQKGAHLCTGKYLWIAESDDFADPSLLETLVNRIQQNPGVVLAFCQSFNADEHSRILGTWTYWTDELDRSRWARDYINGGRDEVARFLVQKNTIPNASAVLVDRKIFLEALSGSETMRLSGDWWTWSRVLLSGDVAFVSKPLNYFRSHPQSVRDNTKLPLRCAEEFRLAGHICARISVSASVRKKVFHEIYYKWRVCVGDTTSKIGVRWVLAVHRDARHVQRSATFLMSWFLIKTGLKKIPGVTWSVRWLRGHLFA